MADSASKTTDPVLGAASAIFENTCRFAAFSDEMRRMLLKTQLKGVEDHLQNMQSAVQRFAGAADWAALQDAQTKAMSDQAELQATLARAWGKVFADATSAWFDQCRACSDDWTRRAETTNGAANGQGAGLFGPLSASLAEFYERIGKMAPYAVVPQTDAPATPRARAH